MIIASIEAGFDWFCCWIECVSPLLVVWLTEEFVCDTFVGVTFVVGKDVVGGVIFVVGKDDIGGEVVRGWVVTIGIGASFAIPFTNVLLIELNDPPT